MKRHTLWLLVTLIVGIPAYFVLPYLPGRLDGSVPDPLRSALADVLHLLQSLSFGFGVCFFLLGYGLVRKSQPGMRHWAFALHLSVSWLLMAWWAHAAVLRPDDVTPFAFVLGAAVVLAACVVAQRFLTLARTVARAERSR